MVAFYEKNGYRQTHIEPEKEGMDMVYMNKMIDKQKGWFGYISKLEPALNTVPKDKRLIDTSVFRDFSYFGFVFYGLGILMMETWQELKVTVKREGEELVSNLLIELGAQGVAIEDSMDYVGNVDLFW